jgi:hypothetical protein
MSPQPAVGTWVNKGKEKGRGCYRFFIHFWYPYTSSDPIAPLHARAITSRKPGFSIEEEVRRAFPDLFSAVGMPNVRELD